MKNKILIKIDKDLEDLIPGYLESLNTSSKAITEAIESSDWITCQRVGHNLKGSGGSYGFDFVSEIGGNIENAASQKNQERIQVNNKDLKEYLGRVEVSYVPA